MRISIRRPFDAHLHLRGGKMLKFVAPHSVAHFWGAVVMPNDPLIRTVKDALAYRDEIYTATYGTEFVPYVSLYLTPHTTPVMIEEAREQNIFIVKLYMRGVTHGSEHGVKIPELFSPPLEKTLRKMEELGFVLCVHGEHPDEYCIDAELRFIGTFRKLAGLYPKMRIVFEHITTKQAIECVRSMPENIAATITPHHLLLTTDDILKGKLRPHNYCLPIAKRPTYREALIRIAMSGNPKFFLGTDSAPHPVAKKICEEGCAGIFNAAQTIPFLAGVFHAKRRIEHFENFVSVFGPRFYRIPSPEETLMIEDTPSVVPDRYGEIVPFMAGKLLPFTVVS
jgi:dihydroorotase